MARTVTDPIEVPRDQAWPRQEILTAKRDGGLQVLGRAANSLFELGRGPLVLDIQPGGITSTVGTTLRYRCRLNRASNLSENVRVYLLLECDAVGSSLTITTTELSQPSSCVWTRSGAVASPTWQTVSTLMTARPLPHASGYQEISVAIAGVGGPGFTLYGVAIQYERDRSTLAAVSAGSAAYSGSAIVPIDDTRLCAEAPVSVARIRDISDLLRFCYEDAVGQIVTTCWAAGQTTANLNAAISVPVPRTRGESLTARFYVYAEATAGTSSATLVAGSGAAGSFSGINTPRWYGPVNLTIPAPAAFPVYERFYLALAAFCKVYSFCGYWLDAEY